jgi:hypothetical protein
MSSNLEIIQTISPDGNSKISIEVDWATKEIDYVWEEVNFNLSEDESE